MPNVLLTCAGRRNYLIRYFREALDGRGEIMASDVSGSASAMQEADRAFIVPPVYDPEYFDRLLALCREHQVRLLLSLNDLELPLLARQREKFLAVGTIPVVSSPAVIDLCFRQTGHLAISAEAGDPGGEDLFLAGRGQRRGETRGTLFSNGPQAALGHGIHRHRIPGES